MLFDATCCQYPFAFAFQEFCPAVSGIALPSPCLTIIGMSSPACEAAYSKLRCGSVLGGFAWEFWLGFAIQASSDARTGDTYVNH
jgi:hypothetical protein